MRSKMCRDEHVMSLESNISSLETRHLSLAKTRNHWNELFTWLVSREKKGGSVNIVARMQKKTMLAESETQNIPEQILKDYLDEIHSFGWSKTGICLNYMFGTCPDSTKSKVIQAKLGSGITVVKNLWALHKKWISREILCFFYAKQHHSIRRNHTCSTTHIHYPRVRHCIYKKGN